MENKEAINVLLHHKEAFEISGKTADAIDMAISALEKQEADRWIPVKEREPTETGLYLVTETTVVERKWTTRIRVARCDVTELNDGRIDVCWRGYGGNVLAWMPLPDPYTEEEL